MKLIKKIAAIMFAFIMVFSLSTNVNAESGKYEDRDGKITISNAVVGQTYTIYRMLKLESFDGGNYSYTLEDGWNNFITTEVGKDYLEDSDGYITFKTEKDNEPDKRLFAKAAFAYAKDATLSTDAKYSTKADSTTVTFEHLPLGYYVVGSTVGSLCELNTTNKEVRITDKNKQPSVKKQIIKDGNPSNLDLNNLVSKNSVYSGETVWFNTTIDIKPGAYNYVLHDKIDSNFTITEYTIHEIDDNEKSLTKNQDFNLIFNPSDGCTFHVEFTKKYLEEKAEKIANGTINKITVLYYATLSNNAPINTAMKNNTYLTYGANLQTNPSETETYTFGIPVFKYTNEGSTQKGLKGVEFSLHTGQDCSNDNIIKFTKKGSEYTYSESTTGTVTTLTSSDDGTFNVNGLKAGTYYLKEISTLDGYNKLANPVTIVVEQGNDGKQVIKVGTNTYERVEVLNNKGSLLPSTGGMGTTLIYLIGGALVLGSGIVLANKKRAKAK
ncbi:SpaA isopeptide-forming pilin-related protein [Holdemanella biformis]|uniref:SpaA isopeptide-forming pilin-related protein n=1 Tax=Holdemanella biformis TaxID=1735 RepID=UPI004029F9CD